MSSKGSSRKPTSARKSSPQPRQETWFLLYCKEDESHSVVAASDVICNESVKVGDEVTFFYGRKKPWQATVKAMSENSDALKLKQNELNAKKPKRDDSFHAERKRKTATRCQDALKDMCRPTKKVPKTSEVKSITKEKVTDGLVVTTSGRASTSERATTSEKARTPERARTPGRDQKVAEDVGKTSVLKRVLSGAIYTSSESEPENDSNQDNVIMVDEDSDSKVITDKDDSESSGDELTAEDIARIKKLADKRKIADINSLLSLGKKARSDQATKEEQSFNANQNKNSEGLQEGDELGSSEFLSNPNEAILNLTSPIVTSLDSTLGGKTASLITVKQPPAVMPAQTASCSKGKALSRKYRPLYSKQIFQGDYFRYKATDPDVKQLSEKYNVYISSEDLTKVKDNAKSATDVARQLVKRIFSSKALEECSVTGRPAAGKGKGNSVLRPPLHADGLNAIFEYARARAAKKKWKEPTHPKDLHKCIADVLCENRLYARLQAEAEQAEQEGKGAHQRDQDAEVES